MGDEININANFESLRLKVNEVLGELKTHHPSSVSALQWLPQLISDAVVVPDPAVNPYDEITECCPEQLIHLLQRTDTLLYNLNLLEAQFSAVLTAITDLQSSIGSIPTIEADLAAALVSISTLQSDLAAALLLIDNSRFYSVSLVNAATYNLAEDDDILHVTYTTTGSVVITWPTAQMVSGREVKIKDAGFNASANNITIETEGAETIDASANLTIAGDGVSITLYCDGSNLFII